MTCAPTGTATSTPWFPEWIAAFFVSNGGQEALMSVMRFEEQAGRIVRLRSYGFCPETIREIAASLGVPAFTGIYRAPTPAPGQDWPRPPALLGS